MKKLLPMLALFAIGMVLHAETPAELLAAIDSRRNIPDMSFVIKVTAYDGEKQEDSNTLWGFVKDTSQRNSVLLSFSGPASVKGRKILVDGSVVYFLFPKTRNPIRLSPLQVLLGQASNGDVARTGFGQDYDAVSVSEAERGGVPCYVLTLGARPSTEDSTYKKVILWVEKSSLRPLYAEFFVSGDKLWKKAVYGNYAEAQGKDLPRTIDIFDAEDSRKHTVMTYEKIGQKSVPSTVFHREYLESWIPEEPK